MHALPLVTSWLGPLVVLLTRGERDVAVRDAACEALNVEITWALVALVLALVLPGLIGVGAVLLVLVVRLAFFLWAMVRAGDGWAVRYPVSLRIVR